MKKEYDIEKVIELRDSQNLKWKEIEEIIGVSAETLRKAYKRKKEGLSCVEANPNNYPKQKQKRKNKMLNVTSRRMSHQSKLIKMEQKE